jgi:microcystin-dependent protein
MSDPFVAEIRMFAGNFAPRGWALCNGQLLQISQNTALFSLLGTTYGGDGKSTFALPNLQGRAPMHAGSGPGLSPHFLGEEAGVNSVTLLTSEMPSHSHLLLGTNARAGVGSPDGNVLNRSVGENAYQTTSTGSLVGMDPNMVGLSGGSQPHNNMQPYLALTFIIALQGIYPPRS